jgi:phage shock protein A
MEIASAEGTRLEAEIHAAVERRKDDIARLLIRRKQRLHARRKALERQCGLLDEEVEATEQEIHEKRMVLERVRLAAVGFSGCSEHRPWAGDGADAEAVAAGREFDPADKEVEWELQRRKEKRLKAAADS